MKRIIKKFVPRFVLRAYHFFLAYLAALRFGFPSKDMVVIGVLGTRGKTTVANLIWSCLDAAGYVAGLTGTANIRIGKSEKMNPFHMTMPGRFAMQRMLSEMRAAGCRFAIVETPSEGVEQWRTVGIAYDVAVMTTLYPEYLETHNWSFERCKEMHQRVFATLKKQPYKRFQGKKVPKIAIVNADIEEKDIFLKYPADVKITYSVKHSADMQATDIQKDAEGRVEFSVGPSRYMLGIRGDFNVSNGLAAIACASALGIRNDAIQKGLRELMLVPGRMEEIKNTLGISVFVDYAHDAISLEAALSSLTKTKRDGGKCIVLTGGQGGGRDREKRPIMGQIAARYGEYVVIANEDPYDDDPEQIMEEIARGSESEGKIRGKDLFLEIDRRNAIRKAISLSKKGDIVFIGGKGSEQSMMVSAGKIPWDDREVVREELKAVSPQQ